MDKSQARRALLKISLLVLGISTWIFTSFLLSTRPEESAAPSPLNALVRLPASLPRQLPAQLPGVFVSAPKLVEPIEMSVVNIPCWDSGKSDVSRTDAKWVRLTGHPCQSKLGVETVTVRNLTTGYVATVFATQGAGLTTDFIPLKDGSNEILIRLEQGPGAALESRLSFHKE